MVGGQCVNQIADSATSYTRKVIEGSNLNLAIAQRLGMLIVCVLVGISVHCYLIQRT